MPPNQQLIQLLDASLHELVIVEGKKDRQALQLLGFMQVVALDRPLYAIAETIHAKNHIRQVIILTDLDKKGRELYGKLKANLQKVGIKVDDRLRNYLQKETEIVHIEGLLAYLDGICQKGCPLPGKCVRCIFLLEFSNSYKPFSVSALHAVQNRIDLHAWDGKDDACIYHRWRAEKEGV